MEYNDLINELLDLLDKNKEIRRIKELKNKLLQDKDVELVNYANQLRMLMIKRNYMKIKII